MAPNHQPLVVIAILAAGASSRMRGGDKLLEMVQDEPMLHRQARLALQTGAKVIVTLPTDRPDRNLALAGLDVQMIAVPDADLGMSVSLRAALLAAIDMNMPDETGFMVLPADMPDFTADALMAVIRAYLHAQDCIVRATAADGKPGHPTIFPREFWRELAMMTGDQGGRAVIAAHPARLRLTELPGAMAITDLDTPEDWANWRAGR